ncbi:hypothetical protein HMPREF1544_02090 [Mucor circinelloides 1006PhL]|uniref:Uncharacterized protein n=1 Tax=Mucor circinelloides f. circinelloides (strain 1006PhL) TaxID=1220926 RepID=S2JL08_MUCC1|nr:hypothetical protein HMPREF1544_02090 [Mucor circinelloides 1006PhL]KAG1114393.1 hypothetical protein G6F42_014195 [Rhizopus arrhizus]
MAAAPVPGERFVKTLRHYLEANETRLLSVQPNFQPQQATIKEEPPATAQQENGILKAVSSLWNNGSNKTDSNGSSSAARSTVSTNTSNTTKSRPSSLYGIPIPYMSLLAAASPNATSLSNTPYMPLRSSLTLDIHYLYFLLVQFEYLGLEDTHLPVPEHGLVETETTMDNGGKAPSISSVGSVMSTLSLSTGWQFWSSNQHSKQDRPLHEDIVYIHRYLSKVTALKLHMNILIDTQHGVTKSGQRTIRGYETPLPQDGSVALPLKCFKNLKFLELSNISPSCIDNWPDLHTSLTSLVIKSGNIDNAVDIIGTETPWSELKMLSLQDNSLTTMEDEPAHLIRSITHLNLSSNLLIDIPAALASLYNLSCLNLSYNMISFTTGINTVLGNIQALDLRGNRLTVLAGLDRLWALERLDVRDNRIDDAAEIGRLTALPNISDIWVEGNPFTKLQPDYRVDIFSVFKKCDLDIDLDGTKPTFAERRRIQVPANSNDKSATISATIATTDANSTAVVKKWPTPQSQQQKEDGESVASHSTAPVVASKKIARAKTKGNKRQIRLGQAAIEEDIPIPAAAAAAAAEEENNKKHVHRLADLEEAVQQEQVSARRAASVRSRRSKKGSSAEEKAAATAAALSGESTKKSSEAFRKKIEAMRREAGTEWLRVLQEMDVVKKTP